MKLTKEQKIEKAKELAKVLEKANHLFFTDYQGLKFVELDELRGKLRPIHGKFSVVKNSLVRFALQNAHIDGAAPELLKGPVGLLVSEDEDPVGAAKVLATFAKQYPNLKIRAGFIDQKWVNPADINTLSSLGTKPELLSKFVNGLYSAMAQSAQVLQAPIRDLALVLRALEDKKKLEGQAAA